MDNVIGDNIPRHRATRPWTQEQLAGASRVDVRTVQRAESGKPIAAESLQAIAGALDVSVDGLMESPEQAVVKKSVADLHAKYVEVAQGLVERGKQLSNMISGSHALYFNLFDGMGGLGAACILERQ
jgi:transcriptional regulator with XRE-family HTH domain